MLPNMQKLLRKFPYMFPDTVTVQELGTATMSDSGAVIPPTWQAASGLTGLACLIESMVTKQLREGETLSTVGQTEESSYTVLFDRTYTGINERQRLVDQNGKQYEITQVTRDDFSVATVLRVKEIKP